MKKLICLFTIITLIMTSIPATLAAKPTISTLRVGLHYGNSAKTTSVITSSTGFIIGADVDREFVPYYTAPETSLTVTMSGDGVAWFGNYYFDTKNATLAIMPISDSIITIDGKSYRGGAEFLHAGNGLMTVINLVSADEYIYGVIGKEMSPSWHIEALKAQAVCARNYALTSLNKHKAYGFDICTATDCQVYGGYAAETESTVRAGMETAGKYLMYNGKLAETLFFSTSGGHTSDPKYVWGNSIAYLKGVPDTYEKPNESSRYSWTKTYTIEEIEQRLASSGINIGNVTGIYPISDPITGQVYELTITGTTGNHVFKNDKTRTWMGLDKLYSQRYKVTPVYDQSAELPVMTSGGIFSAIERYVQSSGGLQLLTNSPITMQSSTLTTTISQKTIAYQFDGNGWGHGVGMSQYGAKGMADSGFTYEQILTYYYTGTYIE